MAATYLASFAIAGLTWQPLKNQQREKTYFTCAGFGVCIIICTLKNCSSFSALFIGLFPDGVSVIVRGHGTSMFEH